MHISHDGILPSISCTIVSGEPPPGKLRVKTRPPRCLYYGFSISFGFQQVVVFMRFSEYFTDFVFYYRHPRPDSLSFVTFFWVLASELPTVEPMGHLQLNFPLDQTSIYATDNSLLNRSSDIHNYKTKYASHQNYFILRFYSNTGRK